MGFTQAISSVLRQYAGFSGRARRSEYWWFFVFNLLVTIVAAVIDLAIGTRAIGLLAGAAFVVPAIAVLIRRLHDTGRSGWWILVGLIPIAGLIILLVFVCQDSQGPNNYGPSPKFGTVPGYGDTGYGGYGYGGYEGTGPRH